MQINQVFPTFQEFKILIRNYNLIPLWKEVLSDLETPVSIFRKVMNNRFCFLLESVEGAEHIGRYSFVSFEPRYIFSGGLNNINFYEADKLKFSNQTENPILNLREIFKKIKPKDFPQLPRFWGGAVGYVSYDAVRCFEEKLLKPIKDDLSLPDFYFLFTQNLIVFDNLKHTIKIIFCVFIDDTKNPDLLYKNAVENINKIEKNIFAHYPSVKQFPTKPLQINSNFSKKKFSKLVNKAKKYIRDGDVIQVVLSRRFSTYTNLHPLNIYRGLRIINPSPYMFFLKFGWDKDIYLIGSSPEILVRKEANLVETRPIAGTRPRGSNLQEDIKLQKEMLADEKELAEHLMLVDLGRNDLGRVSKAGSVKVPEFMSVEKYSHVMHIVSSVKGKLKSDKDIFDLFQACFPAGTVTGAPKIRAMEIIDELEKIKRGPYAGAVGYFSYSGNMDMAITIRTIILSGKKVFIQAGAGIVADSQPQKEYEETNNKAKALIEALKLASKL